MNRMKALRVAELRKKLAAIPAKAILAFAITVVMNWNKDLGVTLGNIAEKPLNSLKTLTIF